MRMRVEGMCEELAGTQLYVKVGAKADNCPRQGAGVRGTDKVAKKEPPVRVCGELSVRMFTWLPE